MDSDEEDFVFFGTPIEREEDVTSRKKKALAEASSQLRALPSWKQEVRDKEGRRRFHGAFTGGHSAGYYNTVGSKEGWAPQTFTSSRKNRAEVKKQHFTDFLDEDEKDEMGGQLLGNSSQFDTFGTEAANRARKEAENEQKQRPSAIPGPVPDELISPAAESIGVKLLMKMGWRHGRSIKGSSADSVQEVHRAARKAFIALSSNVDGSEPLKDDDHSVIEEPGDVHSPITPMYVRQPKQDLHGLGYDPYKHAPEFRELKRSRIGNEEIGFRPPFSLEQDLATSKLERLAPGFGLGALEEFDVEDEDIYTSGHNYTETYIPEEDEQPIEERHLMAGVDQGTGPKFRAATKSEYQLERFAPPSIPKDFVPQHKFPAPLDSNNFGAPPPPEVPLPEDNNLKIMVQGVAALVARCGRLFEDISREKNQGNPLFSFLNGGRGHEYYERMLWEAQQKHKDQKKLIPTEKLYATVQKMTAENRGKILGERPLEKTIKDSSTSVTAVADAQSNLSDTLTKPEDVRELLIITKPFKDDPEKQERFEQFLKDKYEGGLRSTDSGKAAYMSENVRARERLDFEAAAETILRAKSAKESKLSAQQFMDFTAASGLQFTSGGDEHGATSAEELPRTFVPKREVFQWRPAPLLCKRFEIVDPFMGKPLSTPRARSKLDALVFTPDTAQVKNTEDLTMIGGQPVALSRTSVDTPMEMTSMEPEAPVKVENVERPVDLYKAIFSDDSDDDGEGPASNGMEDPQKKTEAATAALSRLVAGDFLESLGKELGLEVLPDFPSTIDKGEMPAPEKVGIKDNEDTNTTSKDSPHFPSLNDFGPSASRHAVHNKALDQVPDDADINTVNSPAHGILSVHTSRHDVGADVKSARKDRRSWRGKSDSRSSSEDEGSRKRSRKHHRRHRSSDDDSDDYEGRHHSRSRDDKRRSRKKHRSRRRSEHK